MVEVEEESGSLVRRSQKKKQPVSVERVSTPSSKLKDVVSEPSNSDEDMLVKSKGKEKSNGGKSGKRKTETVQEPGSMKRLRSEGSSVSERLRHQKVLLGRTFDPAISEMAGMRQVLEMVEFQRWGHLLQIDAPKVYENEVQSFFATLFPIETDHVCALVNGIDIVFDVGLLGDILKVPTAGESSVKDACQYNFWNVVVKDNVNQKGDQIHKKALLFVYQLLFELVNKVLLPCDERRSMTLKSDMFLMEKLDSYTPVGLHAIMIEHMQKVATFKDVNHGLPYGFLLTQVFKFFEVPLGQGKVGTKKQTFSQTTLEECECIEKNWGVGSTSTISQLINAQNSATEEIRRLKARNAIMEGQQAQGVPVSNDEVARLTKENIDLRVQVENLKAELLNEQKSASV
ncbi:uncharacterized protein [Nicotiana sylvestris]|uniref:uncharacterized protein n=1 Tax=Nicotiana sylvestris TaxID=4096 RepID=UPI00388C4FF5